MISNSKKLPCGHIFHTSCLRSWFQRQQTCPTCRLNILRPHSTPTPAAAPAAPQGPIVAPPGNCKYNSIHLNVYAMSEFIFIVENMFANMLNQAGVNPGPGQVHVNPAGAPTTSAGTASSTQNQVPISQPFPFGLGAPVPPPFPFMAPFTIPPPPMPPNLSTLTDEELRALEGTERQNVENRIKVSYKDILDL